MRAVVAADPVRERAHLVRLEMVDLDRDAVTAELVDQRGGLLDGFGSVVVGLLAARHGAATRAHHGCARLAQRRGNAPACAARRSGDHGHPAAQGLYVRCPVHRRQYCAQIRSRYPTSASWRILAKVTPLQRYIAEEIATDHVDGLLSRREALRRLALLGVGTAAATR